jgi:hypothetical protein|nr:MAG TPA: hypothetical protein [Caudoviricetes sp.]
MEERSADTGVVSELEKRAMRGDMMPDGLSLAEQELFQGLSYLYARYHLKVIDRATGSREKGALKHTFALRKSSEEFERRLAEQRSTILQTTETAITRYRKERTLEAADALADAVDGVLI